MFTELCIENKSITTNIRGKYVLCIQIEENAKSLGTIIKHVNLNLFE